MSDRMPAEIWIGGKIAASLVPDLCDAITRQGVATDWGEGDFQPATAKDLEEAVKPDRDEVTLLWLCHDQTLWGEFASLERFLEEHRVPFTRFSAGRYDYDPDMAAFRPGIGRVELPTNGAGHVVVPASRLVEIEAELSRVVDTAATEPIENVLRSIRSARDSLRSVLPPPLPPLEPFEIVSCTAPGVQG